MTLYAFALACLGLIAFGCTLDLIRMRREAQERLQEFDLRVTAARDYERETCASWMPT